MGNLATAEESLKKSEQLYGSERPVELLYQYGHLAASKGCWEQALEWYSRVLGLMPESSRNTVGSSIYLSLGNAQLKLGNEEEAIHEYLKAISIHINYLESIPEEIREIVKSRFLRCPS